MLFTDLPFAGFFGLVFVVHWALQSNRQRKLWLLAASYVFYGLWDWRLLGLLGALTALFWLVGLRIQDAATQARRRAWLLLACVAGLGALGTFKYLDFFMASAAELSRALGWPLGWNELHLVLPVGISFYVFHSLGYVVDVHRGIIPARRDLGDFALFVAFFPQLVAGPILRATHMLPQFDTARRFEAVPLRDCLMLFLLGFIKKAVIADTLGGIIDPVFAAPGAYAGTALFGAVLCYAVQIYCDFSGYTDMALACAGLLGYRFPANFNRPYLAVGLVDFWRRWHISLSGWLRDYLYIPLGGNRHGRWRRTRNLLLTMMLGGLWHGAAWTFLAWGTLHGLGLVAEHAGVAAVQRLGWAVPPRWQWPLRLLGWAATFWFVCLCWVFFRAPDLDRALIIAAGFATLSPPGGAALALDWLPVLAGLGLLHWGAPRLQALMAPAQWPASRFAAGFGAAWALALALKFMGDRPFIYFQF